MSSVYSLLHLVEESQSAFADTQWGKHLVVTIVVNALPNRGVSINICLYTVGNNLLDVISVLHASLS